MSIKTGMFNDYTGSTSNGRIIATIMVISGLLIAFSGCVLAYIEVLLKTSTGFGIIIVGSGIGLSTTAIVYISYHKTQETKTEIENIRSDQNVRPDNSTERSN